MIDEFTEIKKEGNKTNFICAYNYNEFLRLLNLVFNNGTKTTPKYTAYQYIGIPPNIVKEFSINKHPGKFFQEKIKYIYPARKLNPVEYKYNKPVN